MKINPETILESLKKVIEPDLGKDIVSLGLVTDIKILENKVSFSVQMKNAAMHAKKRMQEACEFAIERSTGKDYSVEVNVQAMKKAEVTQNVLPNKKYYCSSFWKRWCWEIYSFSEFSCWISKRF